MTTKNWSSDHRTRKSVILVRSFYFHQKNDSDRFIKVSEPSKQCYKHDSFQLHLTPRCFRDIFNLIGNINYSDLNKHNGGKHGTFNIFAMIIERLRNENEDKTKTQITHSFNHYSENETKIWRQNVLSVQSCVFASSSFSFRNLSNISLGIVVTLT